MDPQIADKIKEKKDQERILQQKQDAFLDVYSLYRKTGLQWIKEEAIRKAYELHLIDSSLTFEI